MKGWTAALGLGALLVAVLLVGFLPKLGPTQQTSTTIQLEGPVTTLGAIAAGTLPTGYDKSGTGGTTVTVRNLTVLYVHDEADGDWHVAVTDGKVPVMITEITPAYQEALGRPAEGSVIDESGVVFCDVQHENESWHGDFCWEIHPVTAWRLSVSAGQQGTFAPGAVNISASYGESQIQRGLNQTIVVAVTNLGIPEAGANVTIEVTTFRVDLATLTCVTDGSGECSVELNLGPTAAGIVGVRMEAGQAVYYSAFEILNG